MPGPDGDTLVTSSGSSSNNSNLSILLIAIIVPCGVVLIGVTVGLALYFYCKNRRLRRVKTLKKQETAGEVEEPRPASGINYANH